MAKHAYSRTMERHAKQHFGGLDGLRGIAALAVMTMHLLGLFMAGQLKPVPAYLSVDLFFMLSGFVLAYAYGAKLDQGMGWSPFMVIRLVRLYPMLVAGVLLGAAVSFTKQHFEGTPIIDEQPMLLLPSLLLIPTGLFFSSPVFPFNSPYAFAFNFPVWSLFFELVASAAFGTRLRCVRGASLAVGLSAITALLVIATYWQGTIAALGVQGVIVFLAGFLRVTVPFTVGVVLYRSQFFARFPAIPFPLLALALLAFLLVPRASGATADLFAVFVLFPLAIGFGATAHLSPLSQRFSDFLGRLSYPLYLLHVPLSRAVGFVLRPYLANPTLLIVITGAATIALSWLVLILYDEPVRRALRRASARAAFRSNAIG